MTEVADLRLLASQFHLDTEQEGQVVEGEPSPGYPRPSLIRGNWRSLDGVWNFGLGSRNQTELGTFDQEIVVPFPVESALSGIGRKVTEAERLWYRRLFRVPEDWEGQRVLLHFDAVDWETKVWLNGNELGTHQGGYDRFSFDITDHLKNDGEQELVVSVWDPSDAWFQPRGKQVTLSQYTYYSGASGIWQTSFSPATVVVAGALRQTIPLTSSSSAVR